MKLQLLHGPANSSSRKKLISIASGFEKSNTVIFESGTEIQTILGNLMTNSLLVEEQLFILENPSEDFTNYSLTPIPYPDKVGTSSTYSLVFWFDHEVSEKKPIYQWVKKSRGEIIFFPEGKETSIFPLLDYLAIGDKKAFLEIKKLREFEIHYIITMIFYLLRSLVVTPKNTPLFVKNKLERQRKILTLERLKRLYKDVLEIDYKLKSGLLDREQSEFLLLNLFYQ